eukprot:1158157-Pelagomonas_calceolata.AAC.1
MSAHLFDCAPRNLGQVDSAQTASAASNTKDKRTSHHKQLHCTATGTGSPARKDRDMIDPSGTVRAAV